MAYSQGAFRFLIQLLSTNLANGGNILEFGCQEINDDVESPAIAEALSLIHGRPFDEHEADAKSRDAAGRRYAYKLFEGGRIGFRYLDLYGPTDAAISCDLNAYSVPNDLKDTFDFVTNWGTTEHVLNQMNALACIHDFLKPGGEVFHSVPCAGYYNHGLFNYHPIFFLFLANANKYDVLGLNISQPHLPYRIRESRAIGGAEHWGSAVTQSAIVNCHLRKTSKEPFRPFTDADRREVADGTVSTQLEEILQQRYDLRI